MGNPITQLRQAFNIPEAVTIIPATHFFGAVQSKPTKAEEFTIDNTIVSDPELYRSSLGTPIFTNLEFLSGQYETNTPGVIKTFDGVKMEAIIISVNQPKKIIKTEIQGRDGTVKEYIGMGDYEITINGIITGKNGVRPVEEINALKKIVDAPIAIGVASAYFQALGIDQIVIDSCIWDQQEGSYSYQTFSINAVSDVPQELRLTNV